VTSRAALAGGVTVSRSARVRRCTGAAVARPPALSESLGDLPASPSIATTDWQNSRSSARLGDAGKIAERLG